MTGSIRLTVNGRPVRALVEPGESLLEVLRDRLGLTGTKVNCRQGECGACTVLLDGDAVDACLVPAASAAGHRVTTIEGLADGDRLDPLQESFLRADAAQCGYCTPGMVMASRALLAANPRPTRREIDEALAGNYCRCTGYLAIVEAIESIAGTGGEPPPSRYRSHVTGGTRYAGDRDVAGMVHGAFVRLPVARARITSIDATGALSIPGVIRVIAAGDLGAEEIPRFGPLVADQPVLAAGATRYQGEPVALVAAHSEQAARAGAAAVRVGYEELPPVVSRDQALSGDLIHDPAGRPPCQSEWKDTNVMGDWRYEWGDVGAAETQAALVIENTYRAPFAHHFSMEPNAAVCIPDGDGITVVSAVQHPFLLRTVLAATLGLPLDRVRVEAADLGGSFGAKGYPKIEPAVAACSLALGMPLKVTLTAEEAFLTGQREASHIRVRTGFGPDGDIRFQDIEGDFLVGAYTDISPRVVGKSCLTAIGPYRAPSARIRARGLFTTTTPTTAFRGFGNTHWSMAVEGQMDAAAAALGIDPLALRLANIRERGEEIFPGEKPVDGDWGDLLRKAAAAIGWGGTAPPGRGRGIAFGMKACVPATSSEARIHLGSDGRATAFVGTTEMGQGARATMATIASRALGIPAEEVAIVLGDTGAVPRDAMTGSSRSTVHAGNALLAAGRDCRDHLVAVAAGHFGRPADDLVLAGGSVTLGADSASLADLLGEGGIEGLGRFDAPTDPAHPLGGPTPFYEAVATAVELHVDPETGEVFLDDVVHVTDAGLALNRRRADGVDDGGLMMGIGLALSEALQHDPAGHLRNGSSLDYRIPTIADLPAGVTGVLQENRDGPGPWGAKGMGEGAVLAIAPAINAAILDCTGVQFTEIPVTPERVWRALGAPPSDARAVPTGGRNPSIA